MKLKKHLFLLLIPVFFICCILYNYFYGVNNSNKYNTISTVYSPAFHTINTSVSNSDISSLNSELSLHSRYAALIDGESNRLLYGKQEDIQAPNASTTKIMTLITALEICCDDYTATTSAYAASMPDVQLNAAKSEQFIIKDLYYSLMLKSHNDTAVIIAENAAYYYLCNISDKVRNELPYDISFIKDYSLDSTFIKDISKEQSKTLVQIFIDLMNKKALELGCSRTHFVTPNGLDATDDYGTHSTTAYEIGIIMSYCIKNQHFLEITQTQSYTFHNLSGKEYAVTNANAFLSMYDNIISGKTGFTADAGYCYVCAYKDNDRTFIVALLACGWPNNKTYKWSDTKTLLNYARNNFYKKTIFDNQKTFNIKVNNGICNNLNITINENYSTCIKDNDSVNIMYNIPESIDAPVKNGDVIGTATILINNEAVKQYPLICSKDIDKYSYTDTIADIIRHFLYILSI